MDLNLIDLWIIIWIEVPRSKEKEEDKVKTWIVKYYWSCGEKLCNTIVIYVEQTLTGNP